MKEIITKKERQQNQIAILNALQPKQQNFNVMLLGFTDIMQESFSTFLRAVTPKEEWPKKEEKLSNAIKDVLTTFKNHGLNEGEGMFVLTTVMTQAIIESLERQEQNELKVDKKV